MAFLIPVHYHKCKYTDDIEPKITEVAGNFDIHQIRVQGDYSLHTEYSFTSRKLNSDLMKKYDSIRLANKKGIPMLWFSEVWAQEFADFIFDLTHGHDAPTLIEIHPSFSDYSKISSFIEIYMKFEEKIKEYYPHTLILIENRSGTRYSGGKFIISKIDQIIELSNQIENRNIELRFTLDLPQLFTAHNISRSKLELMNEIFSEIENIRHNIRGIHLWGKRNSENGRRVSHVGDLNDYFMGDMDLKRSFLELMYNTFNDDIYRYFVPEVNSGSDDLQSIVADLKSVGFEFC